MLKVNIVKNAVVTHSGTFATEAEANTWVAEGKAGNWWGLPEREVELEPAVLDENGVEIQPAVMGMLPAEFEVMMEDISTEYAEAEARRLKVEAGRKAREACQDVLDFIAGANLEKSLTIEQITQMQQTFANAEAALRAGRPTLAKSLISAISPDGIIVTEAEKSECLLLLADY